MPKDTTLQDSFDRLATISKKLAETKEPRKFDFTSTPLGLTIGQNEGTTFANIAKPANFDKVPVGAEAKITVKLPTNPAELPPTDDVQVAMIGTYLWIDKTATNIMNWGEVKTQLQAGKIMVLTRLADTDVQGTAYKTFQLARWEDAPVVGGSSGHWETIDPMNYHWNANNPEILVRLTIGVITVKGYLTKTIRHGRANVSFQSIYMYTDEKKSEFLWHDLKNNKAKVDMLEIIYTHTNTPALSVVYHKDYLDITKFEILREA